MKNTYIFQNIEINIQDIEITFNFVKSQDPPKK